MKFDPLSIPVPDWLDADAWGEWVAYRRQSGKAIKTELTVTKAFKLLQECLNEGHNPVDVINTSIANGYQGLFKPKFPVRPVCRTTAGNAYGIDFNNTDWIEGVFDEKPF